jgi:DNA-binding CsgD family transcriptional regulator
MSKSSASRAEARFKQLCCLGLGGEMVMPSLFEELRRIVPSITSTFFFADGKGQLASIYDDAPESPVMAKLYLDEFHNRPDRLLTGFDFAEAMRTQSGVFDVETQHHMEVGEFRRSEFYNVFYRYWGWDSFVRLIVREPGQQLGLGRLTLHRGPGERPFSEDEKRRINALQPFLAHALVKRTEGEAPLMASGRSGVLIADRKGRIVYSSVDGRDLLLLSGHPNVASVRDAALLPPALVKLCRNLDQVFHGGEGSPPVHHLRNIWGGFRFRAHWLDGSTADSGLVCITVTHEEPVPLRMMRAIRFLPLSARQAEVAFLLATGESNEAIAERLGITRNTAIAHGRWVYNKLDVHNRAELVNRLLSHA